MSTKFPCFLTSLWKHLGRQVEVVPKKISDYQVSEKIHSKAGAEENIIMEIPLWPSAAENV